ncbi:hypothetical protein [Streptomyces sp. NPDC021096]|uniref:hypothetical protein n=1 Tax=Streptomyces sp. NPDC021096 TaxID=3154792 RepID=UPI0033D520DF
MDLHALGRIGTLLHRAHTALSATDAVQEPGSDRAQAVVVGGGLGEARELIGQARDHVLVVYALANLRIGLPQDRPARIHDTYTALASAADKLGVTTGASPPSPTARLADACRDMSRAVMLLAPFLGPRTTAGANPHTPVRLATHLQLAAESAGVEPAPHPHSVTWS